MAMAMVKERERTGREGHAQDTRHDAGHEARVDAPRPHTRHDRTKAAPPSPCTRGVAAQCAAPDRDARKGSTRRARHGLDTAARKG